MPGGGYDISASRAEALAQDQQSANPTIINFGAAAMVTGGRYGFEQTPTANATAARNIGEQQVAGGTSSGTGNNLLLYAAIGIAAIAALGLVYMLAKKKS